MNKNIVVFARSIPQHNSGGLEVVTWDLCKGLASSGISVELVTTIIPNAEKIKSVENLKIVELPHTEPGKYSRAWWENTAQYLDSKKEISAVISVSAAGYAVMKNKSDFPNTIFIMQAHGTALDELKTKIRSGSIIKACKGIKNFYWIFKDLFFYKKFDFIIGIGDAVINSLSEWPYTSSIKEKNLVKIENGIDEAIFKFNPIVRERTRRLLNIRPEDKVIISVSRLHSEKGVDNNLKVISEIINVNKVVGLKYIVCGGGKELEILKEMASSLGISGFVIFVGDKTRSEISELLCASDLFLFLTKRIEGLPLNVLEAQSSGIPMVISEHLTFDECKFVKKSASDDVARTAELVMEMLRELEKETRSSYIHSKNTLINSTRKYQELLTRD